MVISWLAADVKENQVAATRDGDNAPSSQIPNDAKCQMNCNLL